MSEAPSLIGLGMSTLDVLVSSEALPRWEGCVPLDDLSLDGGGMAANTLVAFSKLGGRSGLVGVCGNDHLADLKLGLLEKAGVDIRLVVRLAEDEPAMTLVFVQTSSGERTFASTGRMRKRPLAVEELDRAAITSADGLFLDGFHSQAALAAAGWMREAGKPVFLDAGRSENADDLTVRSLIPLSTVLFGGAGFGAAYSGANELLDAGKFILSQGRAVYVETLGEQGSWTFSSETIIQNDAFAVNAVDTTGAGDVFHGAFLLAWMQGRSLLDAGRFASAAAAIKCMRRGAQAGCPTNHEVMSFLAERQGG